MKLTPEEEVARWALALREAAPLQWENLLQAMTVYVNASGQNIYKCDPKDLARVQGFGQAMIYIRDLLNNAPHIMRKAQERVENERIAAAQRSKPVHA